MKPVFFTSGAEFRAWLKKKHARANELVLGFYNKDSENRGITYAEALDAALCFGWIDGLVRRLDPTSHTRRFTPRKPGSIWSNVNVRHVERLKAAGKMRPAGLTAFAARDAKKTGIYSFEQKPRKLPPALAKIFRSDREAWTFWLAQPPGYRRAITWWIVTAKQEETRHRRLAGAIAESAAGRRMDLMRPKAVSKLLRQTKP